VEEKQGQQGTVENVITDRVYNLRTCMPKHQHAACMCRLRQPNLHG